MGLSKSLGQIFAVSGVSFGSVLLGLAKYQTSFKKTCRVMFTLCGGVLILTSPEPFSFLRG